MEPKKKQPQTDSSAVPPAKADPRAVDLEATVKSLEEQLKKMTDLAARAQADLQNARARMERAQGDLASFASEEALRRLLPVIDGFQRAFLHLPADLKNHEWVKGISGIEQELMRQVSAMGLRRMNSLGLPVDPHRHEVLLTGEGAEGAVTEVFEEGYELNGRVLRPARVKVGSGGAKGIEETEKIEESEKAKETV